MIRASLLLLSAASVALAALPARGAELVDRVVLRVNDEIVTLREYRERREMRLESIAAAEGLTTEERRRLATEAGRAALRELFDEALVLSRARQLRIDPTPSQLDAAIDSTRERMGIDSAAEFERALAENGLTRESYRQRMKQNIAFNEVMQREVQAKVTVEDDVLLRLYRDQAERFRTPARRRVEELVVVESAAPDAGQRRVIAEDLRRALEGGESMAAVAERVGADVVAGPIDLGWVVAGELAPELDRVVQALEPGAVSEPVEARAGVHLLVVREVRPAGTRPFDEVKETLRVEESRRLFEEKTRELLADLERKAYVVENLPEEAVGYRTALPENPEAAGALGSFAPARAGEAPPPAAEPAPLAPASQPAATAPPPAAP